jgi:hypothetical protein
MSRWLRFAATAATLILLFGTGCTKKNSAPAAPDVLGPASARPADTLTYRFNTTDPDGDNVFFKISWGDGASTQWSTGTVSGEDFTQTHVYEDSGTYYITAKAKDGKDAESALSDSFRVRIGSFTPDAPVLPTGPSRCSTGLAYAWSTRAVHPLHDSVRIQFSWGDGTIDSFGRTVASNTLFDTTHTYSLPDTYKIAARARDAKGFESPWSETLVVIVDTTHHIQQGAPRNLVLTAMTDSTIHLAWLAPSDTSMHPLRFVVLFTETGTTRTDSIGISDTFGFVHDPVHRTGRYQVAAVYPSGRVTSTQAPSTTPAPNTLRWIPELSSAGDGGYWWNRTTGAAYLYSIDSVINVDSVDFYVTDFAAGFTGPTYYAASPDSAPHDPGGSVPSGNWHITKFTHLDSLADENSILPHFLPSRYKGASAFDSLPRLVACHTEDDHYALLRVQSINTTTGEADIETWFQLIPGLRLIQHN